MPELSGESVEEGIRGIGRWRFEIDLLFEARDVHLPMFPGGLTPVILATWNAHWRPASLRSSVWTVSCRPELALDVIVELGSQVSVRVIGF